jgi:apolipoprotein N-acyltransferase
MKLPPLTRILPDWKYSALAVLSAILLILAFPDFDLWFLAWFGLAPLLFAIERECEHGARSFVLGWLWGLVFFFGTCWWLTFAPITYAGFPWLLAYALMFCLAAIVAVFPGIFALILSLLYRRLGGITAVVAPFVWVFSEFLRYWLTGNNWNALGYSQAFSGYFVKYASVGGVHFSSFLIFITNDVAAGLGTLAIGGLSWLYHRNRRASRKHGTGLVELLDEDISSPGDWLPAVAVPIATLILILLVDSFVAAPTSRYSTQARVIAIQPNVPMSGLTEEKWRLLRQKHVQLAEAALASTDANAQSAIPDPKSATVIFPESPMNFMWEEDEEFRNFVHVFAAKHNVQVLFNSAEPDAPNNKYFNSAVLVGPDGREIAQYDKIYLLPFGESVPAPLQPIVPAFVGSFSYGKEFDLLPVGGAKAGVMICFESHFGELSREYVLGGADVLIEMTNDGYLGPTPVLKQHLANAVFRAVETNRPVLRVTNVGVTAYINERGEVLDPAEAYTEDTRVWNVAKSDGSQTFYVKHGDWFAWLCSAVTVLLLAFAIGRRHVRKS